MPTPGSTNHHPRPPPASKSNRPQGVRLSGRGGRVIEDAFHITFCSYTKLANNGANLDGAKRSRVAVLCALLGASYVILQKYLDAIVNLLNGEHISVLCKLD